MPTVISPSEKKRLVDGAFRVGGIGLWGMKRGRAWRPTLPAAEWGDALFFPVFALLGQVTVASVDGYGKF